MFRPVKESLKMASIPAQNRLYALNFRDDMGGCMEKFKTATEAFCALSAEFYENIALFRQKCRVGIFP